MTNTCDRFNECVEISCKIIKIIQKREHLSRYDLIEIMEIVMANILRDRRERIGTIHENRKLRTKLAMISELLTEIVECA